VYLRDRDRKYINKLNLISTVFVVVVVAAAAVMTLLVTVYGSHEVSFRVAVWNLSSKVGPKSDAE
jgi:hypothetical protein